MQSASYSSVVVIASASMPGMVRTNNPQGGRVAPTLPLPALVAPALGAAASSAGSVGSLIDFNTSPDISTLPSAPAASASNPLHSSLQHHATPPTNAVAVPSAHDPFGFGSLGGSSRIRADNSPLSSFPTASNANPFGLDEAGCTLDSFTAGLQQLDLSALFPPSVADTQRGAPAGVQGGIQRASQSQSTPSSSDTDFEALFR